MLSDFENFLLVIFLVCEFTAFALCVLGNLIVIYVMISKERLKNSASMYILSTSIADLLVGFIAIPYGVLQALDQRPHDFEKCFILMSLMMVVSGSTLTSMIALSVGRFWAICFPFSYRNQNTFRLNLIIIAASWITSVMAVMPLFTDQEIRSRFNKKCTITTFLTFSTFRTHSVTSTIYTVVIILLYFSMYRALTKQVIIILSNDQRSG